MHKTTPIIPSIIHKPSIELLCKPLEAIGDIKYFVLYIIFNDGQKFVLSSTPPDFLSMYWNDNLKSLDYSARHDLFIRDQYYLCNETLGAETKFKDILESSFNMYRTYYIERKSPECRFVFGALHDYQVLDPVRTYHSTIHKFEQFCIDFVDQIIDLIKVFNPNYNRSIILNDKSYRKSVIKMEPLQEKQLTEREIECLYWAAHGKSSDETAMILQIKKYTVEDYRKNIKKKLNCSTLAHAVYEGVKRGYISAFHRLDSDIHEKANTEKTRFENNQLLYFDASLDKNS